MKAYIEKNREFWNELTRIHASESDYYRIDEFRRGASSLKQIEREELGEVRGKSLLHLQCHFGLDTLSWARLGAEVTGVDIADDAIVLARRLAEELQIPAEFVRSDLYDLPAVLTREFDIVFASYGTTVWLPDLERWAALIARYLKPGGVFYIVDGHPFSVCLGNQDDPDVVKVVRPYFHRTEPDEWQGDHDYANPEAQTTGPSYEWTHSLGDIVSAVAGAGLKLEFLHEFPFCEGEYFRNMERTADGWYQLARPELRVPHTYSLLARRPG